MKTSQHTARLAKSQVALGKKLVALFEIKKHIKEKNLESQMPDHDEDDFNDDEWNPFEEGQSLKAREGALTPAPWHCARCGQANETIIDLYSGYHQEYVEDCAVCCRPNLITVTIDPESLVIALRNELEYE